MKITRKETKHRKVEAVELRTALVEDVAMAEAVATDDKGKVNNTKQAAALLSQIATFDGENLPMEDVMELAVPDFLQLMRESGIQEWQKSVNPSSTSAGKESSAQK